MWPIGNSVTVRQASTVLQNQSIVRQKMATGTFTYKALRKKTLKERIKTQRVPSIMPRIREISAGIQMERFVSVSSDWNIRDHTGGGPHISVGIFQPKFPVPSSTNRLFALIREFGKRISTDKSHFYWLARFNRKISFHFPQVFPLISDR